MNNKEIIFKEKRKDIFLGIISLSLIIFLVTGLTLALFREHELFLVHCRTQYVILISILIIGIKDALSTLFILCTKFISPYYIKFNSENFYDCKLKQYVSWNKIDSIEFLDYKKRFNKKELFEHILYTAITKNFTGSLLETLKYFLLSAVGATKNVVIITCNKRELLKKAGLLKKIESYFLPDNMITINIEPCSTDRENIINTAKNYLK